MKKVIKKFTVGILTSAIIASTSVATIASACKPNHAGYRRYESVSSENYYRHVTVIWPGGNTETLKVLDHKIITTKIKCSNCNAEISRKQTVKYY